MPGTTLDRPSAGGAAAALQPTVVFRGDAGTGTGWTLDGMDVGDPASPGASTLYVHPEILGGVSAEPTADVHVRLPGVPVRLTTERAAPGRGRAFARLAPKALQSAGPARGTLALQSETQRLAEAGGRLDSDLAGGAAQIGLGAAWSEIRQRAFTEHDERFRLMSALGRLGARVGGTRLALSCLTTNKRHQERDTTFSAASEARWRQSSPTWVTVVSADRAVGDRLAVAARAGWLDSRFRLDPPGGSAATAYEDSHGIFRGSYLRLDSERRRLQLGLEMTRRAGSQRGPSFTLGAGYRRMAVRTESAWPGNKVIAYERDQVFFRAFHLTGFAIPTRDQAVRSTQEHLESYASATLRRGRFGLTAGARLDWISGHGEPAEIAANPTFPDLLPAVRVPESPAPFHWLDLLPRITANWADRGGRLRLRGEYAAFAATPGSSDVTYDLPGREVASLTYYWRDRNADHSVQADELDLVRGQLGSSGLDPERPASPLGPNRIDRGLRAPLTREWSLSADTTASGTTTRLTAYYRRSERFLWRPLQGLGLGDYAVAGEVHGRLFEDDYSVGYYAPVSISKIVPGSGRVLTNRDGYHQEAAGVELSASSHAGPLHWTAWAAFMDWRERFDDVPAAVQDPTPTETEPLRDGGTVAVRAAGLGRSDVFVSARWSAGVALSCALPGGVTASAATRARDGFPIPYYQTASTGDPTGSGKNVFVAERLDRYRLPTLVELDVRLERTLRTRVGRLIVGADAFNVLDRATTLQVSRDVELPAFSRPREVLRPRIVRLGVVLEL